jgi:6-phosphofructokinase 1
MRDSELDFSVAKLGECHHRSPMTGVRFTDDDERVIYHSTIQRMKPRLDAGATPPAMEAAGPRQMLFFDPAKLVCGIVTCGGSAPG